MDASVREGRAAASLVAAWTASRVATLRFAAEQAVTAPAVD